MTTYNLYLPFELAEGHEIKDLSEYHGELRGYELNIKRNAKYYTLVLKNIPNKMETEAEFQKIKVALYWMALELGYGILWKSEIQELRYFDVPITELSPRL
jgi:hypothetical protein